MHMCTFWPVFMLLGSSHSKAANSGNVCGANAIVKPFIGGKLFYIQTIKWSWNSLFLSLFFHWSLKSHVVEAAECGENTIAKLRADLNTFIWSPLHPALWQVGPAKQFVRILSNSLLFLPPHPFQLLFSPSDKESHWGFYTAKWFVRLLLKLI